MKKTILSTSCLFFMLLIVGINSTRAALYPFTGTYSGSQENPANLSPGTGTISGVYNDVTNTIFFTINFSGLMTNTAAAHFHAPAAAGVNAPVIYGYTGFPTGVTSGSFTGSFVITEPHEVMLKSGLWYSNIHTTGLPGGEIRSQITLGSASSSIYTFNNTYSGTQENPPNNSPGTGVITGTYNPATNTIFYRIVFSGLVSPTAAAHFHAPAAPGVNAGVIYGYTGFPTGVMAGSYSGTHTITDLQETQLLTGLWYSNIHTAQFPGGEIRSQISLELAPTITCPANIVRGNDAGLCSASISFAATSTGVPAPSVVYSINNVSITSPHVFPVGTSTVNVVATNSTGTATCSFTVTVNDTEGPVIGSMSASPGELWPPNNKMRDVTVNYTSTDNCPGVATCVLSVTSNEPGGAADYSITDAHHLMLRAKRNGSGNGRVYTITARCTDLAGNATTSTTTVTVPHDMSAKNKNQVSNARNDAGIGLTVSSNPTSSHFGLEIQSVDHKTLMSVKLVDLSGRIMEIKNNVRAGQFIRIGQSVKPGLYLLQLNQGQKIRYVTLLKH